MAFEGFFKFLYGIKMKLFEEEYATLKNEIQRYKDLYEVALWDNELQQNAIETYKADLTDLQDKLDEMEVCEENPTEIYWNSKYPSQEVKYSCRKIVGKDNLLFSVDVRYFFMNSICSELQNIVKGIKDYPNDDKMLFCQKWVKNNIGYVSDSIQYKHTEYWADALETLKNKRGDCDDGAILMANLAVAAGIPYWRVRVTAGDVPEGGHAYLTYLPDDELKKPVGEQDWKVADWCYYPNIQPFNERPNYKDDEKYYSDQVWFSFNSKHAFKKGTAKKRTEV